MTEFVKDHKAAVALGGIALVGVLAWLAFGVFGIHTAFVDNEVDEAGPVFASETTATTTPTEPASDATTADAGSADAEAAATPAEPDETVPTATEMSQIVTIAEGTFSGSGSYEVNGAAVVLTDGSDQRFLRFENFEASNGPDLKVYLRANDDDFVSLGDLKGNIGDQNYEIPVDVDLSTYSTVQIWCERFSANFGQAPLT